MSNNGCIITDNYVHPTSWDDLDSVYLLNGDYAGWVDAIRTAMWERVNVCLNGVYRGTQLNSKVVSLGYFEHFSYTSSGTPHGYRGDCEVYDFALKTEQLLDFLLTPYREYGTVDNYWGPTSEQGYFVDQDPHYWYRKITYASPTAGDDKNETVCYVKFLNTQRMFEDQSRNYKLAMSGVARGDTLDKFVPFFNAVKNALNYMTVIPVSIKGVGASIHPLGFSDEDISVVESKMRQRYNDYMADMPDPDRLDSGTFRISYENSCRINNSAKPTDTEESYRGHFGWYHEYPYQANMKLPPITFNLYRGYWAKKPDTFDDYDSSEFCFGSEYNPQSQLIGEVSGYGHYLGGDAGRHYGSKFPSDSLQFPSTPGRGEENIIGYELHGNYFADFNVEGGFNFRGNE
jgi:hypothetical protein